MRILHDTPDMLVVRDRSTFAVIALMVIAVIFATLGSLGVITSDAYEERLVGGLFAIIAIPLAGFALYIAKEHLHVFDRRRGVLIQRMRPLIGAGEDRVIPLERIRDVEIDVEHEVADPDTYRLELVVEPPHGGPAERLPMRDYRSSDDPSDLHAAIRRWLHAR